jgi:tetratricopeptide (TPR) repeat protein
MSNPSTPDAVLRQIAEALRASDLELAARLSDDATRLGLHHPILNYARGVRLATLGRHRDAIEQLREAAKAPNVATLNALAMSLAAEGEYTEAAKHLETAITLQPGLASLQLRKGWALELAGELEGARKAHIRAVELEPGNAEALARIANLAARRGDWLEARRNAEQALQTGRAPTAARLSLAMCSLEDSDPASAERHLRVVLDAHTTGPTDRTLALGLLGDVYDRQGRISEAFRSYHEAKQVILENPRRRIWAPTMFETVTGLIRYFEGRAPSPMQVATTTGLPHIFVLGFLRSGTSLVQHALASRDDAVLLQERDTLSEAARSYMAKPQDIDRLWAAGEDEVEDHRETYWQKVRGFGTDPAGRAMIDGMPINTIKIPLIAKLFPAATILFVVRDPRDVILSCFRRSLVENATTNELLTLKGAARFYNAVMTLAELYRSKLALRLHQIRLEDVIADFDGELHKVCDVTGLSWEESMRHFAERSKARGIATPSGPQLARGLNASGVGQWKRYREFLQPVLPILAPWVERFGYEPD